MPKSKAEWYPRKKPHLQIEILKFIASRGQSSQKQITNEFQYKPSTISDAFTVLKTRKLIKETRALEFKSAIRREKFYKLSPTGLSVFIDEIPSPHEFWIAIIWYLYLNANLINQEKFDRIYDSYIEAFVGNFPLRTCFFLGTFFDELFGEWAPTMYTPYKEDIKIKGHIYSDTTPTYKVLEYLLLNRKATLENIIVSTQLSERKVRNILDEYSMEPGDESYLIRICTESEYLTNKSVSVVKEFLNHLVISPAEARKVGKGDKQNDIRHKKYELSLLGVILMLATISSMQQKKPRFSSLKYYDKIASNYPEKLPMIFGKWKLLRRHLRFDWFPTIFDYLFIDKTEILSLSILLGGNKEIYDNIRSAMLNTVSKFAMVYNAGTLALDSDYLDEFPDNMHYSLMEAKLDEINMLLRYSSVESFIQYMMKRKKELLDSNYAHVSFEYKDMPAWKVSQQMEIDRKEKKLNFLDELHYIENAIAEEFSFLFFIGLLRENDSKASDYPITISIPESPGLVCPKWFLERILHDDTEIRNKLLGWIDETLNYQKLALEKIKEISVDLCER